MNLNKYQMIQYNRFARAGTSREKYIFMAKYHFLQIKIIDKFESIQLEQRKLANQLSPEVQ